jgi:hypothetical protein
MAQFLDRAGDPGRAHAMGEAQLQAAVQALGDDEMVKLHPALRACEGRIADDVGDLAGIQYESSL